jgi:crotonobetainyl-CoA:carnitine CoA-transferase CaiB-like acyl-CoA transferase
MLNEVKQPISASSALSRFTVIDLSRVRSGPTASRQLADWGANVISIEQPASINESDPHVGPRSGSDFQNLNRNRRSITLNLKRPEGVEVLKRLVQSADVVLENFRPDVKDRLGINYEALSAVNPRLVYASISGFGQDGPYRNRPGFDQIAQGMGGIMSVTGTPGEGPVRTGIPVGDLCSGLFCAFGILVALLERETSGKGQWVQTSLVQSLAFMLDFQAARWLMDGVVPTQHGNHHPTIVPTGSFKTGDGHINLAIVGPTMWERFCGALGMNEWLDDHEFKTNADRIKNQKRLHQEIESILSTNSSSYWVEFFNAKSVPCGPIYRVDEMFEDPQFKSLGMVQSLASNGREVNYLGQPVVMTRTPSAIVRHPPSLGEHTNDVLRETGYSLQEIERLREMQVL